MGHVFESPFGKAGVIIYALGTIVVYGYVALCGVAVCGTWFIMPVLPWAYVMRDLGLGFPLALYPVFVLLNASVAYILGTVVEWMCRRFV